MFGPRVSTITTEELAEKMKAKRTVLLDVREPHEFAAGHVPGAVNTPLGRLMDGVEGFSKETETLVICASGHRSATAARRLMKNGFKVVFSVKGGTSAWRGKVKRN